MKEMFILMILLGGLFTSAVVAMARSGGRLILAACAAGGLIAVVMGLPPMRSTRELNWLCVTQVAVGLLFTLAAGAVYGLLYRDRG